MEIYNSKNFKRSQKAYISHTTFEALISLLVADVFLANLLSNMGASDASVGIIATFATAVPLFQVFSIFFAKRFPNTKRFAAPMHAFSMLSLMLIYLVPFAPLSQSIKTALVAFFMFLAFLLHALCSPLIFTWANSFVSPQKRATYSAKKETITLLSTMVFSFFMGLLIDKFSEQNKIEGGFLFIAATILVLNVFNFLSLMLIKDKAQDSGFSPEVENVIDTVSFKNVICTLFKNKNFVSIIFMTTLSSSANAAALGFLATYKLVELGLSVGLAQVINISALLIRTAVALPFGKMSDKKSFAYGLNVGHIIAALSCIVLFFTTPNTWWLIIIHTILFNVSQAGTSQNYTNILYSYVDGKYISQAMSIKNFFACISVIVTTFISSKVLSYIQENGNMILGIHIYAQQFLALISTILLLLTVVFVRLTLQKQNTRY